MKNLKILFVLATGLFTAMGSVFAADEIILTDKTGTVQINKGESYGSAAKDMEVFPDNLLLVEEGAFAELTYPNGCVLEVYGEFLLTVDEESPCVAGALLATAGVAAAAAGVSTGAVVGGVLALGLGIALVTDDDDDPPKTISP